MTDEPFTRSGAEHLPLPLADWALLDVATRVKALRRALSLTPDDFAARFRIPLEALRSWENGSMEPNAPASAYLQVIAFDPEAVERAFKQPMRPEGW
jgi:putative transcriptional regulator